MNQIEIENIEVELLVEAIYQRYGYDFRSYSRASLKRRIMAQMTSTHCSTISQLQDKILRDVSVFDKVLLGLSVNVTSMFRDPLFYKAVREEIIPVLRTFPFIKIWHAGCSTGEEVYSMAILLWEENLYNRVQIYATDFNEAVLKKAREGIIAGERIPEFTEDYKKSGGTAALSDYYIEKYDLAIINKQLKKNILFADHNLASDGVFGEMNLIICRNVLIYFNKDLQNRAIGLFHDSLTRRGYLCLGTKENLKFSAFEEHFEPINKTMRIYKKSKEL